MSKKKFSIARIMSIFSVIYCGIFDTKHTKYFHGVCQTQKEVTLQQLQLQGFCGGEGGI